ncbi:unnamed protein product [Prunus armeniaca]
MQQQIMEQPEEELKEQLQTMEVQRDRAVVEQREMKKVADEANMRLSEELSTQEGDGVHSELNWVKDLLSDARQDLKSKEENIESLKLELGKAKDAELKLAKNAKTSEVHTQTLLSQGAERIRELELKADNAKTSEAQTKALLAESKKRIRELEVKLAENLKSSEAEAHTKALLFASEKKVRDLELKLAEKVETSELTKALLSEREGRIQELELKLAEKVETSESHTKALLSEREGRIQELELKLAEKVETSEARMKALLSEREVRIQELELKLAEVMKSSEAEAHTKTLLSESEGRIQELEHKLAENVKTSDAHTKALLSEGEGIIRELELKLAENVETSEADTKALLSENDERIRELEMEIEKRKQSEARILDSLITQTNQLQQTKVLLEEAKFEIASIQNKLEKGEDECAQNSQERSMSHYHDHLENNLYKKEELESLKSEIQLTKESLVDALKKEQLASSNAQKLLEEMGVLKRELKLTAEAEENGKKAMDDLAFALKEVATEANQLKDKLCVTQAELEHSRSQEECLNSMLKSSEESYKALLDEAKKEAERYKNTSARLKIEHEESVLAWSGKETGFVDCIRRAEEDRYAAQQENFRLHELLLETDNRAMVSKEENSKLRDILKQALNEANVAKGATAIAQAENSQLKDTLTEKEDALNFLARENENYRVNEIAAHENIKELKRLLIESSKKEEKEKSPSKEKDGKKEEKEKTASKEKEGKKEEKEKTPSKDKELKKEAKEKLSSKEVKKEVKEKKPPKELKKEDAGKEKPPLSGDAKKEDKEKTSSKDDKEATASQNGGLFGKVFSFNLKELKISNMHEEVDDDDHEIEIDEALKGSIFEVDSPGSATHHRRNSSFTFTDDGETLHSDDYDHLDGTQAENSRKKKALLRRFGDLIKRSTTYTKKEPSPSPDTKKEPSPSQDAKEETSPTKREASPE